MLSDIDICRSTSLTPIDTVAQKAGLLNEEFQSQGRYKAKVSLSCLERLHEKPIGKFGGGCTSPKSCLVNGQSQQASKQASVPEQVGMGSPEESSNAQSGGPNAQPASQNKKRGAEPPLFN